jgi:hypothetical protein
VPDTLEPQNGHEVTCPHCKRAFTPKPLRDPSGRATGYKCPHCRLFVAADRAEPVA